MYLLPANAGLYERPISVGRFPIQFHPDLEVKENTLQFILRVKHTQASMQQVPDTKILPTVWHSGLSIPISLVARK